MDNFIVAQIKEHTFTLFATGVLSAVAAGVYGFLSMSREPLEQGVRTL